MSHSTASGEIRSHSSAGKERLPFEIESNSSVMLAPLNGR